MLAVVSIFTCLQNRTALMVSMSFTH